MLYMPPNHNDLYHPYLSSQDYLRRIHFYNLIKDLKKKENVGR